MKFNKCYCCLAFLFINTFSFNSHAQEQGFFLDDWKAKTITAPVYTPATAPTQAATVTVNVDAANVLTKVSKYVFGHNSAGWAGQLNQDVPFLQHVSNLNPNVIRWPGGNLSNDYFWNATSQATTPKDLPPDFKFGDLQYGANKSGWTMSTDAYYDMLAKTGSKGIICVNYAYARYSTSADPVATAAKHAADWVRYDNGRTRYWEIGNENYGNWETGYTINTAYNKDGQPATISGELYGKHARVFIDAMRQAAREVGNDIKIGVVAMDSSPAYNPVMRDWNKGLMPQIADKADYIILHSYYTPYDQNSTVATILDSATTVTKTIKDFAMTGLRTHANHAPLPVALTEWNIFAKGSGQAVSYINGMHAALLLGEVIKNNYGLATRWDFLNGFDNGNSHGLFSDAETDATKHVPRAPFFYMYYFQKMFGDRMVNSSVSGSADVVSYASTFTSGQSGVVVVNKGNTQQIVNLKMNNFNVGARYYYYVLTGGTDNGSFSRKVYVNGQTTNEGGGGPQNYATLSPYGSAINGDIKLTLPKTSVLYVVVDKAVAANSSRSSSSQAASIWTACANENQTCSFSGTKRVRYGAGTSWKEGVYTGSVLCGNQAFGDPIPGTFKTCQIANFSGPASSKAASSKPKSSTPSTGGGNCKYTVASEWNNGFTGTIRITNNGTNAMNGWNVNWAYTDGSKVTSNWNSTLTGNNPYNATNVGWNGTIQPGQFVEFGFQANKGTSPNPQIPVVTGPSCK